MRRVQRARNRGDTMRYRIDMSITNSADATYNQTATTETNQFEHAQNVFHRYDCTGTKGLPKVATI